MSDAAICWHCGKKLQLPAFATVTDQIGNEHRVHRCCEEAARRSAHPLTARETEHMPRYLWTEDPR